MRFLWLLLVLAGVLRAAAVGFRLQEIGTQLGVVYAVSAVDVNGDSKRDIVAINNTQLLWFENPSWTKHIVAEKITKHDNVCVAPEDIDGDGKMDFALGADWQASNTTSGGSLHWITHAGEVHTIGEEPTLHRIQWTDTDGDGRTELIVVPLHGRDTKPVDWTEGPGARILAFRVPANPGVDPWPSEVIDDSLHVVHNFITIGREIWVASAEGIFIFKPLREGKWSKQKIGQGSPGEIKLGHGQGKRRLATVEPWHGNSIVVYEEARPLWKRRTIDSKVNQAHALSWADFDGDGQDELAVGWRGKPWGLAVYDDAAGSSWAKTTIDNAVAVEDLTVADFNEDGRPDIVAGGRTTQNLRIYWNEAK
jgi:hypothetical protein